MSDNIFVYNGSSSEYETSSEEEGEEEVQVIRTPKQMKFYEHTNYVNNNIKILPVIIKCVKSGTSMNDGINFSVNFDESIIIHKICDVYLDNLVTFNCINNDSNVNSMCFLLDIKELDINTKSSENIMKNKVVIPNSHVSSHEKITTHRNKKMNFISTIQPKMINTLSGSLTLLNGTTEIWHSGGSGGIFTMELNFIFRN